MQNGLIQKECPLCGARISLGSRALAKKVRCPQCREAVVVSSERADFTAPAPVKAKPESAVISPPENAREFAVEPIHRGAGFLDETQKHALLRHLSGAGERHIIISAPANDPDALQLSHSLQKLFRAAGWRTSASAPLETNGKHLGGLALYTGAWPFPEEVTKSCMALTAAGLEFTSHIDPCQVSEKAILVVGRNIRNKAAGPNPGAAPEHHASHPIFEELSDPDWEEEVKRASHPEQSGWLKRVHEAAARESRRLAPGALLARGVRLAEVIATHLSDGSAVRKRELAVLRDLSLVLADLRKATAAGALDEAALPAPLVRQCARLALALLKEGPGEIERGLPQGAYHIPPESTWISALRFADAAFARPPVSDDPEAQNAFETLLLKAFRESAPPLRRIIAVEVRAWHWFRTAERRALHDQLFYHEAGCESVTAAAFGRLQHWPSAERERILRGMLQRDDIWKCEELAETLGYVLGWESMLLDGENNRLPAAALAREVLEEPSFFRFLNTPAVRREFLRHFVIGMTEGAKRASGRRELADDFAAWCHRAWLELEALEDAGKDPRGVALLASHWLGKPHREEGCDPEALAHWWRGVSGLLLEVVRRGGMRDGYMLFARLRDGAFSDLAAVEEIFDLIEAYLRRIEDGSETLPAEPALPEEQASAWRDIAGCIADILAGLLDEGRLVEAGQFQLARRLLLRLATELGGSYKAAEALLRFEQAMPPAPEEPGSHGFSPGEERAA